MLRRIAGIVVLAAIAAGGWWLWRRESRPLHPTIVTPAMDARALTAPSLSEHVRHFLHAHDLVPMGRRPKLIALTFDDGPYPIFTPLLLDELHALRVPATFFLIGRDAREWPALTRRIVRDGNEVADHTYSHPDLDRESAVQVAAEILRGRDVLWVLTHDPAVRTLMRPPHGRYTLATLRTAQRLGYTVVLWTDDSGDWRVMTPAEIEAHVFRYATAPEVLLLHSGKLATVEALPAIVRRFREAGYTFVTVGTLLDRVPASEIEHPRRHVLE